MSDIIHYYNMWNEYAYLIPIISVLIVGVLVLWCCICPVYRCFVKPFCHCCYRCMGYRPLNDI